MVRRRVFTFFRAECVAPTDYADKLLVSFLTLVVLGVLSVLYGVTYTRMYGGDVIRSSSVKGYLVLIYIVLPTMSSMAFSAFNVDRVSQKYLQARRYFHPPLTIHNHATPKVRLWAGV